MERRALKLRTVFLLYGLAFALFITILFQMRSLAEILPVGFLYLVAVVVLGSELRRSWRVFEDERDALKQSKEGV